MTAEYKKLLWELYAFENYPRKIAESGPWIICQSAASDRCAAIPRDRASGHLPSQYGTVRDVQRMIERGELQPAV